MESTQQNDFSLSKRKERRYEIRQDGRENDANFVDFPEKQFLSMYGANRNVLSGVKLSTHLQYFTDGSISYYDGQEWIDCLGESMPPDALRGLPFSSFRQGDDFDVLHMSKVKEYERRNEYALVQDKSTRRRTTMYSTVQRPSSLRNALAPVDIPESNSPEQLEGRRLYCSSPPIAIPKPVHPPRPSTPHPLSPQNEDAGIGIGQGEIDWDEEFENCLDEDQPSVRLPASSNYSDAPPSDMHSESTRAHKTSEESNVAVHEDSGGAVERSKENHLIAEDGLYEATRDQDRSSPNILEDIEQASDESASVSPIASSEEEEMSSSSATSEDLPQQSESDSRSIEEEISEDEKNLTWATFAVEKDSLSFDNLNIYVSRVANISGFDGAIMASLVRELVASMAERLKEAMSEKDIVLERAAQHDEIFLQVKEDLRRSLERSEKTNKELRKNLDEATATRRQVDVPSREPTSPGASDLKDNVSPMESTRITELEVEVDCAVKRILTTTDTVKKQRSEITELKNCNKKQDEDMAQLRVENEEKDSELDTLRKINARLLRRYNDERLSDLETYRQRFNIDHGSAPKQGIPLKQRPLRFNPQRTVSAPVQSSSHSLRIHTSPDDGEFMQIQERTLRWRNEQIAGQERQIVAAHEKIRELNRRLKKYTNERRKARADEEVKGTPAQQFEVSEADMSDKGQHTCSISDSKEGEIGIGLAVPSTIQEARKTIGRLRRLMNKPPVMFSRDGKPITR